MHAHAEHQTSDCCLRSARCARRARSQEQQVLALLCGASEGGEVLLVLPVEESAPLLSFLYAHSACPEFTCRFRWQGGSLAFWDKRCDKHIAVHDIQHAERHMRRVQIAGETVA